MSTTRPSALSSLDDYLALLSNSLEEIRAAKSVNIADVIEEFETAAESVGNLRALILSELPDASWNSREELEAVLDEIRRLEEARAIELLRSRLLDLASELEAGNIVHRRVSRLNELTQLREEAVKELRARASVEGTPQTLPGPEAKHWIQWVWELQEPEDAESLQSLRTGFPRLDDFVTNLEPEMWVVETEPDLSPEELEAHRAEKQKRCEELRSRLLELATELERGSIVHHRTVRVSELNNLRDEATKELRARAAQEQPRSLPGPDASEWVQWACSLQEPDDAEALQALRKGFARLDDFIANLEPNMWKPAGPPSTGGAAEDRSAQQTEPEPARTADGFEEYVVTSGPIPIRLKAPRSSGGREEARVQYDEPTVSAVEAETAAPEYDASPKTEDEMQEIQAQQDRAMLARMRGGSTDRVRRFDHRVESPTNGEGPHAAAAAPAMAKAWVEAPEAEVARETNVAPPAVKTRVEPYATVEALRAMHSAPAVAKEKAESPVSTWASRTMSGANGMISNIRTAVEERVPEKWRMPVIAAAVLLLAGLLALASIGILHWRSHRVQASNPPVAVAKTDLTASNPDNTSNAASTTPAASATRTAPPKPDEKPQKPKDQAPAPKPTAPVDATPAPPTQISAIEDPALRRPSTIPKESTPVVEKEVAPPNGAAGVAGSVPGFSGGIPNSVINVVKNNPGAQPKVSSRKVTVSSGVAQGLLVHHVAPQYPDQAKALHLQGTVVLQAVIGKDGTVQNVKAVRGNPVLSQAAMDAVKQWRYRPYTLDGEPVEVGTEIDVKFTPHD